MNVALTPDEARMLSEALNVAEGAWEIDRPPEDHYRAMVQPMLTRLEPIATSDLPDYAALVAEP